MGDLLQRVDGRDEATVHFILSVGGRSVGRSIGQSVGRSVFTRLLFGLLGAISGVCTALFLDNRPMRLFSKLFNCSTFIHFSTLV